MVFLYSKKWAILEKQYTKTRIESNFFCVASKPKIKSIDKSSQIMGGIGSEVYKAVFWEVPLAYWQVTHLWLKWETSHFKCR